MSALIRKFSVDEVGIREQFAALIRIHWEAVQRKFSEDKFRLKWGFLSTIETNGMGHFLGAFKGNQLIGYYVAIFVESFHTEDLKIAQDLGWFVHPDNRAGGVGIRLLDQMEKSARDNGCRENAISVKILKNDEPGKILLRRGYECSEHRYTKQLIGG